MNKLNNRNIIHNLIIVYPLINIITCYVFNGDNMNVFSWAYCMVLCALVVINRGLKMSKKLMITFPILIITILISFLREESFTFAVGSLLFSATVLYLLLFEENKKKDAVSVDLLLNKSKLYVIIQIAYVSVLLFWVSRHGLRAGWNTWVLQGPYNYPHTLSYILLFFLIGDLLFFLKRKEKIYVILAGVSTILVFMTAVRTTLFSAVFVFLYFFRELLDKKKMKYLIIVAIVAVVAVFLAERYGLLNALFQKTKLAVTVNNSFSNGRLQIASASLRTLSNYKGNKILCYLFGTGLTELANNNNIYIGERIHAHNDFIDILVCYGIINLTLYVYAFFRSKKAYPWFVATIGLLAAANGLYMYIDCIPIIVIARLYFENGDKLGAWSMKRLFVRRKQRRYAKNIIHL